MEDGSGACSTRIRLYNGAVRTDYDCVDTNLDPVLCSGAYNSNTTVYECCTDGDFCNENLSPTLPTSSDSTNSSTNAVTSITPSSVMVSTSSAIGPTPDPGECYCCGLSYSLCGVQYGSTQ